MLSISHRCITEAELIHSYCDKVCPFFFADTPFPCRRFPIVLSSHPKKTDCIKNYHRSLIMKKMHYFFMLSCCLCGVRQELITCNNSSRHFPTIVDRWRQSFMTRRNFVVVFDSLVNIYIRQRSDFLLM